MPTRSGDVMDGCPPRRVVKGHAGMHYAWGDADRGAQQHGRDSPSSLGRQGRRRGARRLGEPRAGARWREQRGTTRGVVERKGNADWWDPPISEREREMRCGMAC